MDDGMTAFTRTSRKRFGGGGYSDDEDDYRKPMVPVRVDSHYSSGPAPPPRPAAPAPPPQPALDGRHARIESNARLEFAPATEIQVPPPDYSVAASSITNTLYTNNNNTLYTNNNNNNLLNDSSSQMSRGGSEDLSPPPGAYRATNNSINSNNYQSGSERTEPMTASVTSADVVAGQSLSEDAIRLRIEQEAARLTAEHEQQQQQQQQQQEYPQENGNNSGKSNKGLVMSRRTLYIVLAAIILLLVAVAVALGLVFGLQSGGGGNNNGANESNSPADNFPTPAGTVTEPPTSCPYCYGGFPPTLSSSDFNRQSFVALGDMYTCGTFQDSLNALGADHEACPLGQAFTWKYCGCPLVPETNPRPTQCTLCENGQAPPGQECANEAAFVDHVGSWRPNQCPNLISQGLENCSCGTTPAPTPAPTPARANTPAPVGGGAMQPTGTGQTGTSGYGLTWQFVNRNCGGYTPTLEISCGEGAVLEVLNATNLLSTTNFNCGAPFDNTLSCSSDYDPNVVDGTAALASIVFFCIGNQQSHWQATATSGPHVGVSCSGSDNLAAHVLLLRLFDFVASEFLDDATCQSDGETEEGACFSLNSCTANPGLTCPAGVSDVQVTQNSPLPANAIFIESGRRDLVVGTTTTTTMAMSAADTLVLSNLRGGEPLVLR